MDLCLLHQEGEILVPRHMPAGPDPLRQALAPYREDLVGCVACLFPWYGRADLCARAGLPLVLGQALSRKAIQGGHANNETIEAPKLAVLLRGGMLPPASVSPAEMRATRERLRRRRPPMRMRAALLAPIPNTTRHYHLPERGQTIADNANRDGGAARCPEPAGPQSLAVALTLLGPDEALRRDVARAGRNTAKRPEAHTLSLRRTVPGSGAMLRLVLLEDSHASQRFPRGPAVVSSCRLGPCAKESAGKRYGTSGGKRGHASRPGAEVSGSLSDHTEHGASLERPRASRSPRGL